MGGSVEDQVTAVRRPQPRCPGSATELSGTTRRALIISLVVSVMLWTACVGVAPATRPGGCRDLVGNGWVTVTGWCVSQPWMDIPIHAATPRASAMGRYLLLPFKLVPACRIGCCTVAPRLDYLRVGGDLEVVQQRSLQVHALSVDANPASRLRCSPSRTSPHTSSWYCSAAALPTPTGVEPS